MSNTLAGWTWTDLRNWTRALPSLLVLGVSVFASQIVACNVHELGHATAAIPLGWEIDSIQWCTPAAGAVSYSHVGMWVGNLQGYAGGLVAALFLYGAYLLIIRRPFRPLRTPEWWAAGLGLVIWIGPQLVIAAMEGSAGPNEDYTELFRTRSYVFVPLIAATALMGVGLYIRRWRIPTSATK